MGDWLVCADSWCMGLGARTGAHGLSVSWLGDCAVAQVLLLSWLGREGVEILRLVCEGVELLRDGIRGGLCGGRCGGLSG